MIDQSLFEEVVKIRRDLHQFPETGFEVHRTANIVATELEKLGLTVKRNVGQTGVVADLKIPGAIQTIAFRADMDALPMNEEAEVPFRSTIEGKAHMCGHDGHTAMLIGAAKLLSKDKGRLKNNIRFIFQPSEELTPGGALGMIKDGCLEDVEAIYGLHVWPWLPIGQVGICPGPMMAQADMFDIIITGKGGHAAAPHDNVDPIVIGSQLVMMVQSIISREISPTEPAVISITRFQAGSAYNVIPSRAALSGTIRTYSSECQQQIKKALKRMAEHVAQASGATAVLEYGDGYPPLINHETSCLQAKSAAATFLDGNSIIYPAKKWMFGEDFSYYLQQVPGCFIQLGCCNESKGCIYPLHHPRFTLDEECFKTGIQLFAALANQETLLH